MSKLKRIPYCVTSCVTLLHIPISYSRQKCFIFVFVFLKKKLCQVIEQTNTLMTSVGKVIIYVLCQFQVLHYWLYVLFFSQ